MLLLLLTVTKSMDLLTQSGLFDTEEHRANRAAMIRADMDDYLQQPVDETPAPRVISAAGSALNKAMIGLTMFALINPAGAAQKLEHKPPTNAIAGGSTLDDGFDHVIDYSHRYCNAEDGLGGGRCSLDDALGLCRDFGSIMMELHGEGYHCPQAARNDDTGKYDCVCYDYGAYNDDTPHGGPATVSMAELEECASAAANVGADANTEAPTAVETGSEAPTDVYVEKLPVGVSKTDMVKHLNKLQHAKETTDASWLQRLTGNVPRKPAQELSSCENAADSNCSSDDASIEYVKLLADNRLALEDYSQIDALLPRIKQFTFVRLVPEGNCAKWTQNNDLAQSSMEYMRDRYPGIPMRQVCAWYGDFHGGVEL